MGTVTVKRKDEATVHVWRFGEDPPEGFSIVTAADGKRTAIIKDGVDVKRDGNGSAYSVAEGGALIEYPDGTVANVGPKLVPKPVAQPDGGVSWQTEEADNDEGVREALAGFDTANLDATPEPAADPAAEPAPTEPAPTEPNPQGA